MKLNEEINRMNVLAGLKTNSEILEEGLLANIAAGLGLTLATFTSALAQTGSLDKLKYSDDKKQAIELAMEDPAVQSKLKELGVPDNNIDRQIKHLKGKKITGYETRTAKTDKELEKFLKLGYHLTAVDRDTVISKIAEATPTKTVESIQLKMDEETMFVSGKFHLNDIDSQNIKTILDSIQQSNSVLVGVTIISSTDKQPLHPRLKLSLESLGYSPDNKGLSEARNNGVSTVLNSLGVDSSIVDKEVLSEQGGTTIDPSARYVVAVFDIIHIEVVPEIGPEFKTDIKSAYSLIKPKVKRHKDFHLGSCRTPVGHYSPKHSAVKCYFPAPK